MRKATRVVASLFGVAAGIAGLEHGYFEMRQGNVRPDSLMIASMGPPCEPERVWHGCEPAMTVIPSFLVTGILAILVGLAILIWSAAFVQRRNGGAVLILLSVALLLVGGGIVPPVIGVIGGLVGTKINAPLARQPIRPSDSVSRLLEKLWPWPLVVLYSWLLGQFVIGYFFNDFLQKNGFVILLLIVGLLLLPVFSARAYDIHHRDRVAD